MREIGHAYSIGELVERLDPVLHLLVVLRGGFEQAVGFQRIDTLRGHLLALVVDEAGHSVHEPLRIVAAARHDFVDEVLRHGEHRQDGGPVLCGEVGPPAELPVSGAPLHAGEPGDPLQLVDENDQSLASGCPGICANRRIRSCAWRPALCTPRSYAASAPISLSLWRSVNFGKGLPSKSSRISAPELGVGAVLLVEVQQGAGPLVEVRLARPRGAVR